MTNIFHYLLYFAGFFACVPVVRIGSYSLYVWVMGAIIGLSILSGRIHARVTPLLPMALSAVITYASANSFLNSSYRDNNAKGLFSILIVFVVTMMSLVNSADSKSVIDGVLLAGKLNVIWIFVQTFFGSLLKFDINDFVFNRLLHMVDTASQKKASGLVATGLCWNVGGIAAALILVFALIPGSWKLLAFLACVLSQSSTAIVGVTVVLIYYISKNISEGKYNNILTKKNMSVFSGVVSAVLLIVIFSERIQMTLGKVLAPTLHRVLTVFSDSNQYDSSATAHFAYYTNLPKLIPQMNFKQFLFGYGIDCSGLPYTRLTHQYWWLDSWFLESDIVNTFLGMGVLGIVSLYFYLIYILVKKWNNNRIISIIMISFIVCGFFYDIQSVTYYWLLFVEFALIKYLPESQTNVLQKR